MDSAHTDPRFIRLLQRVRAFSRAVAPKYKHVVDCDDAEQLASLALWRVVQKYGLERTEAELYAFACTATRRALVDEVRAKHGQRRHIDRHGFQFVPGLVEGLRATGDLPAQASEWHIGSVRGDSPTVILVDSTPGADELLDQVRDARAQRLELDARLARLSAKHRRVVTAVLLGNKQTHVAKWFGLSEPRVSQILTAFVEGGPRKRKRYKRRKSPLDGYQSAA